MYPASCFRALLLVLVAWGLISDLPAAEEILWQKVTSTHFIVMFTSEAAAAQSVSDRAEAYYSEIAADLGYTRYQNFWLWDNRVKILIYPTADAFTTACHAPAWAAGRANAERHEIASFNQSGESFLSSLLPHEMSHLILGDFIGQDRVPLWLTEGFAQWEQSRHLATSFPPPPRAFKLKDLMVMEIRQETNEHRVALFYSQSANVVGFLIKTWGGDRFGAFCRGLRDGKTVEASLATAYPADIPSIEILEQKWLNSLPR